MKAPELAMVGLIFDVLGAFLLAVEAIKIKNLKKLIESVLVPSYWAALPRPYPDAEPSPDRCWIIDRMIRRIRVRQGPMTDGRLDTVGGPVVASADIEPRSVLKISPSKAARIINSGYAHLIAGFLVAVGLNWALQERLQDIAQWALRWLLGLKWWLSMPLGAFGVVCILAAIWLLGEMVHIAFIRGLRVSIVTLAWVEDNTASGLVGILGFVLLAVGFALQVYANYMAL